MVRIVGLSGYGAVLMTPSGPTVGRLRADIKILHAPIYDAGGHRLSAADAVPDQVWVFHPPSALLQLPTEVLATILRHLQHYDNGVSAAAGFLMLSRRLYWCAPLRDVITTATFEVGWGPGPGGGRCKHSGCQQMCDSNMVRASRLFPKVKHLRVKPPRLGSTPGVLWARTAALAASRWTELASVDFRQVLVLEHSADAGDADIFGRSARIATSSAVRTACMSLLMLRAIGRALGRGTLRALSLDCVDARPLQNPVAEWQAACLTELELGDCVSELVANEALEAVGRGGPSELTRLQLACTNAVHPLPAIDRMCVPVLASLTLTGWPCNSHRWRGALSEMLWRSSASLAELSINCCVLSGCELSRTVRAWEHAVEGLARLDLSGSLVSGPDLTLALSRLPALKQLTAPSVHRARAYFPSGLARLEVVLIGESVPPMRSEDEARCFTDFVASMLARCPALVSVDVHVCRRSRAAAGGIAEALRAAALDRASVTWGGGGATFP